MKEREREVHTERRTGSRKEGPSVEGGLSQKVEVEDKGARCFFLPL